MVRCVEFSLEALEELEDLPAIARQLTRVADEGRVLCGQDDPGLWELEIAEKRIVYRQVDDEIWVVAAESIRPTWH